MPSYQENMQKAIDSTAEEIANLSAKSARFGLTNHDSAKFKILIDRMVQLKEWIK